jgi:hypothetical protein
VLCENMRIIDFEDETGGGRATEPPTPSDSLPGGGRATQPPTPSDSINVRSVTTGSADGGSLRQNNTFTFWSVIGGSHF